MPVTLILTFQVSKEVRIATTTNFASALELQKILPVHLHKDSAHTINKYNKQSYQEVEHVNFSSSTWYGASQNCRVISL